MPKIKRTHLLVLVALCLSIGSSVGLITSIGGLFITPIADEFGVGRGSSSLNMTIVNLACALGGSLLPKIMTRKTFRPVLIGAVITAVASTILLSFTRSLWLMYVLNGIRGFATGFTGLIAATVILNNWFHRNTALITSIAMAFSGVAGAIFTPIFASIITKSGWSRGYLVCGILMAILFLPLFLFRVTLDPSDAGELAYGEEPGVKRAVFTKDHLPKVSGKIPAWLFILAAFFAALSGFIPSITPHFTGISVAAGFSEGVGATMLSITMVINTAGKLLLGFLIDRIGIRSSMLIYIGAILAGLVLIILVRSIPVYYVAAVLIGFSSSTCTVGLAMTCREAFGITHYTTTYPKISLFSSGVYAFATTLNGLIYDMTKSYTPIFYIMFGCTILTAICVSIITGKKRAFR